MPLTIQLTPDLEARLLQQAARAGMNASEFVATTLASQLAKSARDNCCSQEESQLLSGINQGLPEELWRRYQFLISRRQAESLSGEEQLELISLSNEIEEDHARR